MFAPVAGKPILAHTLSVFELCSAIDEIVLVVGKHEIEAAGDLVGRFNCGKVKSIVAGGSQRQDSVYNGLAAVTGDIVAIHDAARPMVTCEIIERCVAAAREFEACIAAVPVIDTIKVADAQGAVAGTIDRSNLWSVQTPQAFSTQLVRAAYERAYADAFYATDDAALVERLGHKVSIVEGSYDNIKITTPADMSLASLKLTGNEMRTGMGMDVHAFAESRKMVLGGVEIDHPTGLAGHSDADVVLHAIADACLGAAALGDIGRHFPDTDPQYKGISSLKLLGHVAELIAAEGWRLVNVDATVVCERPKIAPHAAEMAQQIADCFGVEAGRISVKGTTTEKLGFTGRGEGIACYAVASIARL